MKLNHDCVRSIMLELEEKLTLDEHMHLLQLREFDTFKKYGEDASSYTILKLIEAGFLNGKPLYAGNKLYHLTVSSITFAGHEFLDNIRDDKTWSKAKSLAQSLAGASISLVAKLAYDATKKKLGLS